MRKLFLAALALGSLSTGCALRGPTVGNPQDSATRLAASPQVPRGDLMSAPRPLAEGELPLLILLDLSSDSMARADLDALSQRLWYDLLRTGHFVMLPRDVLPRLLADRGIVLAAPFREPLPLTVLGRRLQADYIVSGRVGRVGDTTVLDCSLLDVAGDRVVGLGSVTVPGDVENLIPRLPGIARDLVSELKSPPLAVRTAGRAPERSGEAPPPRPPNVRALVRGNSSSAEAASTTVADTSRREVEATSQPEVSAPEPPAEQESTAAVANVASVSLGSAPPPIEEEQSTFLDPGSTASDATALSPADANGLSASVQIANARQELRDEIDTAVNPHGTLATDPEEAANFRQEANSFPADSPMRARMLERALELDPQDPTTLLLAAQAHFVQQEFELACDECLAAIALQPDNANAHTILGAAYYHLGENALAVAAQMRALELQETNHFAQYNLALSLEPLDPARAAQAFERYVEMAEGIDGQSGFIERAQDRIAVLRQAPTP